MELWQANMRAPATDADIPLVEAQAAAARRRYEQAHEAVYGPNWRAQEALDVARAREAAGQAAEGAVAEARRQLEREDEAYARAALRARMVEEELRRREGQP